jgi:branched-chain amino acid transport system substrate-binding protein
LILTLFAASITGCNNNATPPPIIVGHVADNKRLDKAGEHEEFGIRLALHDMTKDGALAETFAGKKIQVNHTKTEGEIDAYEAQAVRLFTVNRAVAVFGGLSAKEVIGLDHIKAPILTFHGQPVVGASNQVFYLGMPASRQGHILGNVVAENEKLKHIVFVQDERRSDGSAFVDAFQKSVAEARKASKSALTLFATVRFGKDPQWHELIERMLTPMPQAIVFVGDVGDFNDWRRIASKDHPISEIDIIYGGSDGDQRLFNVGVPTPVLFATAFNTDSAAEKIAAFRATCKDKFHFDGDVHAALAYDGMRILVEAMKRTPAQVTPEKLHEELLKTKDFDGLTGPLTITAERQTLRPLHVMRWQNGTVSSVKIFAAAKEEKKE